MYCTAKAGASLNVLVLLKVSFFAQYKGSVLALLKKFLTGAISLQHCICQDFVAE